MIPLDTLWTPGIVAIIRLKRIAAPDRLFESLVEGGIQTVEVTLPTPESTTTITRWREMGIATVGAGTVRTATDVKRASDAGAEFLVTPTTSLAVLRASDIAGLPVICGALTPSEIDRASQSGATLVKIFPISAVGGLAYLKAIAAPLDNIRVVPTGGVDTASAKQYSAFGCAGVGVGSALVDENIVIAGRWREQYERALKFVAAWVEGKQEHD